ncbi:MAG: beta galactosidase jelly roll domain-containing protein [Fidelibacterota bacterium]
MTKIKLTLVLLISTVLTFALDLRRADILISSWRFEIGDNLKWADPKFDDSNWEKINVPSSWEEEGFPGYDGYAWYRVKFKFKESPRKSAYYLKLGVIDDIDVTFVNGHMVGFNGSFPPDYQTAYNVHRQYIVPAEYLNFDGPNVIAVRVYDDHGPGGIHYGDVGVYKNKSPVTPIVELSGRWKFQTGDNLHWKAPDFDDEDWKDIFVPGVWQMQGYKDYLGFAWYRREFFLRNQWQDENLILLLGKIDDLDETYLNGQLLGKTGEMVEQNGQIPLHGWEYSALRAYYIPRDLLNYGQNNIIAVRVYDGRTYGGIYEGPVGIITREQYLEFKDKKHYNNSYDFRDFFKDIFGN